MIASPKATFHAANANVNAGNHSISLSGRGCTLKGWNKWNQQLLEAKHPIFSDGINRKVSGGSFSGEGREAAERGGVWDGRNGLRTARLRLDDGEAAVLSEGVSSAMTER